MSQATRLCSCGVHTEAGPLTSQGGLGAPPHLREHRHEARVPYPGGNRCVRVRRRLRLIPSKECRAIEGTWYLDGPPSVFVLGLYVSTSVQPTDDPIAGELSPPAVCCLVQNAIPGTMKPKGQLIEMPRSRLTDYTIS